MFYRDTPGPDALAALSGVRHACLWLDRSDRPATAAPVTGDESADLLVVGGGFTGLWTALLAKRADPSRDVVLVEGGRVADGASGRNGGFVAASLTHGLLNGIGRWPDDTDTLLRLGRENLAAIVDINLARINRRLADRRISVEVSDAGRQWLANRGYDPVYGARPLRRLLQNTVEDQLARKVLGGEITDGQTVQFGVTPDGDGLQIESVQ
mgnify:CR=1 FL=1